MKLLTRLLFLSLAIPSLAFAGDAGDYDGGGGGTLPADPVSTKDVSDFIRKEAKLDLRLFLKYELYANQSSSVKINSKLYDGPRTIYDVMEETDIEVRMDRPCYDNRGAETDASIYADFPNAICFSAARVAPKLPEELMRKEVLALLLHEFSHLLGTTEKEAREYQAESAFLLKQSNRDTSSHFLDSLQVSAKKAEQNYLFLQGNFDTLDPVELRQAFSDFNAGFESTKFIDINLSMSIYTAEEAGYIDLQSMKLMLANWYVSGESGVRDSDYWKKQYEKAFEDKQEITLSELHEKIHNQKTKFHGEEKIARINSKADLKSLVEELGQSLDNYREYLSQLEHSLALRPMPAKSQPKYTAWSQYMGKYAVVKKDCQANGTQPSDYSEFSVIPESAGSDKLALRVATKSSWSNLGLYDGAGDTLGGAAVYVSGGEATAIRTSTFGDLWGERWIKNTWKMEKGPQGYVITETRDHRQQSGNRRDASSLVCNYTVEKIAD